ncbi:MAG: hypothetical protein AAB373_06315 [Patescibacteria group bacterium]
MEKRISETLLRGGTALLLALSGCKKDPEVAGNINSNRTTVSQGAASIINQEPGLSEDGSATNIDLPEVPEIPFPNIKILDGEVNSQVPEELNMNPSEFADFAKKVNLKLATALSQKPTDTAGLIKIVNTVITDLQNDQPAFRDYITKYWANFINHPDSFFSQLKLLHLFNTIIGPQNIYATLYFGSDGRQEAGIYTITDRKIAEVSNGSFTSKTPVLYLDNPILEISSATPRPPAALYFRIDHQILVHKSADSRNVEDIAKTLGLSPEEKMELSKSFSIGLIDHEAIHAFDEDRLPNAPVDKQLYIGERFALNDKVHPLAGPSDIMRFSEMAGMAAQIIASKNKFEHRYFLKKGAGPQYKLAQYVLGMATLNFAPESPLKADLIKRINGDMSGDINGDLELLVKDPGFTVEKSNEVGLYVYRFAEKIMEQSNAGQEL